MPATIRYKSGYPSAAQPVQAQAAVESSGMINGSATFIISEDQADKHGWSLGNAISKSFFNSLRGVSVQGLFVDSLNLEKSGGLYTLRVAVIGAINPPIVETKVDISPRSISKSQTDGDETRTGSFDYLAETWSASVVLAKNSTFLLNTPQPKVVSIYNRQGSIWIRGPGEGNIENRLVARERIITTETRQERNNIVTVTKTSQFIYE